MQFLRFAAAAAALAAAASATAGIRPAALRCEYLSDPLAIDRPAPRLGWQVVTDAPSLRGQAQSAYRLLVASSPTRLAAGQGDLWDTGKVDSASSIQIAYAGKPLSSYASCWWKVRIWDGSGAPGVWSAPARWSMGILKRSDWKAQWIGCDIDRKRVENPTYLPAPLFRKEFTPAGRIKRAVIYVTAAGLYELMLNGKRVGDEQLRPGWTEFQKRVYYQAYDVTSMVRPGKPNCLGAMVGDGWYGLHHGGRGRVRLLAQLRMEYADGTTGMVGTDNSWRTSQDGPIRMADIYNGEDYDARMEIAGWATPGYDASRWVPVVGGAQAPSGRWDDVTDKLRQRVQNGALSMGVNTDALGDPIYGVVKQLKVTTRRGTRTRTVTLAEGQQLSLSPIEPSAIVKAEWGAETLTSDVSAATLQSHPGSPVRQTGTLKPVSIKEPAPGVYIYNLAQNMVGWVRLKVKGPAGTKVTLRFAEMLNPDGTLYTTNLRGAKCTDHYTLKGGGTEIWEPRFTFHGFQYVEVTGYPGKPTLDAITGIVLNSDAPMVGSFSTPNALVNRLYKNIVWGQMGNYLEVPTDCPQRDERMGWSGDAQAFIGTGLYNMDAAPFFTAWLNTFNDSQSAEGAYPDVSPKGWGVSPAWGDAGIICPWTLWRTYGDTQVIKDHWPGMKRWIDFLKTRSTGLVRPAEGYGDWLNVQDEMPKEVISTGYFAYVTSLMAEMADAVGKKSEAAEYRGLFAQIKAAYNTAFVSAEGRIRGDNQSGYLQALAFDLLPTEKRKVAADRLVELIAKRDDHFSVGFLGVNIVLPILTDMGHEDLAWKLFLTTSYPSFLYPVTQGATTIWERWDGWRHDKGFQNPGMNSFNHYAYGSCGRWMFSYAAGIESVEPGFGKLLIRPHPSRAIGSVSASYNSPRGPVKSSWRISGDKLSLSVTLPPNTSATVLLPTVDTASIREGGRSLQAAGLKSLGRQAGRVAVSVGSGTYRFTCTYGK
jgi:alpha-L-rhamnosidase